MDPANYPSAALRRFGPRSMLGEELGELYEAIVASDTPVPFDRYQALDAIIGDTWLVIQAHDPQPDRMVAIKILIQSSPAARVALLDQGRILAKLSHPNIAPVYGAGQWRDWAFIVMGWNEGSDGAAWVEWPRNWKEVRDVFTDAGSGLAAAHVLGILHRDFGPSKILIGKKADDVMVADFGLTAGGPPAFMAPERLRGEPGDARSDQYSFCVSLWLAWFGVLPYAGETSEELLEAIARGEIREKPGVHVPRRLVEAVRKGLAADPDERHPDMLDMLDPLFQETHSSDDARFVREPEPGPTQAPATLADLLKDKPWATWGPPIGRRHLTHQVIARLARSTGLTVSEVVEKLHDFRRYLLLEELSETSHAIVFAGTDVVLARDVVIKIHNDSRFHATQQAIRESQVMARFVHPNIVQVHDVGEQGQWMYSVIERCDLNFHKWHVGESWQRILRMLLGAAHGLAYLHEMGYVHGDIKPPNILVQDGRAKLADFGHAARIVSVDDNDDHAKDPGVLVCGGTPGFVAPEVHRDGSPGFAGDVFALAVTIWMCIFGEKPFPGAKTISEGVLYVETCEISRPSKIPAGLPKSVLPLLERALNPNPRKRPDLEALIQGLKSALDHAEKLRQRRRWRAAIVVGAFVTLGVGFSLAHGTAWYRGTGDGAPTEAVLGAFDPLTRAEIWAGMGDGEGTIAEINRIYSRAPEMSTDELERVIARTVRIAEVLGPASPDHAATVRFFTKHFQRIQRER